MVLPAVLPLTESLCPGPLFWRARTIGEIDPQWPLVPSALLVPFAGQLSSEQRCRPMVQKLTIKSLQKRQLYSMVCGTEGNLSTRSGKQSAQLAQ